MSRTGGPKQPYTSGIMADGELHLIRLVMGGGRYRATCGREGPVDDLKDRTAGELLHSSWPSTSVAKGRCPGCFTVGWQYHLLRESRRTQLEVTRTEDE